MRRHTTTVGVFGVITMAVSVTAAALLPAGRVRRPGRPPRHGSGRPPPAGRR
jgi:hypothetical protein